MMRGRSWRNYLAVGSLALAACTPYDPGGDPATYSRRDGSQIITNAVSERSYRQNERDHAIGGAIVVIGSIIAIGAAVWIVATLPKCPEVKNQHSGKNQQRRPN